MKQHTFFHQLIEGLRLHLQPSQPVPSSMKTALWNLDLSRRRRIRAVRAAVGVELAVLEVHLRDRRAHDGDLEKLMVLDNTSKDGQASGNARAELVRASTTQTRWLLVVRAD